MQFGQLKRREFIFELAMTSRRISGGVGVRYESSAVAVLPLPRVCFDSRSSRLAPLLIGSFE